MSNVTVQRLGDEAQLDNEYQSNHHYIRPELYERAPHLSNSAPQVRAWGIVAGLFWLGISSFTWLLAGLFCWRSGFIPSLDCVLMSWLARLATAAPLLIGIGAALVYLWRAVMLTQVESWRGRITRDRYSNPVDARAVVQPTWNADAYFASAQQAEMTMAPFKQLPAGLDSLSMSSPSGKAAAAAAEDGSTAAALIAADVWLPWLDDKPHFLLAAETGGGKSVTASVVVARRVAARGDVIAILDPHWSPEVEADEGQRVPKWGGIAPAARSHAEIRQALMSLRAEYNQRMEQLRAGTIIERHFPPLTVVIDEVPEVVAEIKKLDRKGEDTWADTTEVLGSGARKVNISVILLTQSPLVQDIGLNTAMRKNFMRVALQHAEIAALLREASDAEQKASVLAAVRGQRYPAALLRDGDAYALDRSDLLTRMPRWITATAWQPPQQGPVPTHVPSGTDERDALARALFARGAKFRPVAEVLRKRGYSIDNNRLSELYREVNGA